MFHTAGSWSGEWKIRQQMQKQHRGARRKDEWNVFWEFKKKHMGKNNQKLIHSCRSQSIGCCQVTCGSSMPCETSVEGLISSSQFVCKFKTCKYVYGSSSASAWSAQVKEKEQYVDKADLKLLIRSSPWPFPGPLSWFQHDPVNLHRNVIITFLKLLHPAPGTIDLSLGRDSTLICSSHRLWASSNASASKVIEGF